MRQCSTPLFLFSVAFMMTACNGGAISSPRDLPASRIQAAMRETVLYSFTGVGSSPSEPMGPVAVGSDGAVYGATLSGTAPSGAGDIYKIDSDGTYHGIFTFASNGEDGIFPTGGVIVDSLGALYGTTVTSARVRSELGPGVVFKLTPEGSRYVLSLLHRFSASSSDGAHPDAALIMDSRGALYGTTTYGGISTGFCSKSSRVNEGCGTVFKLTPQGVTYSYSVLYRFAGGADGENPAGGLLLDSAGNLYGTTMYGGTKCGGSSGGGCGTAFELSNKSGSYWSKTTLYSFGGSPSDGAEPQSAMVSDGNNFYGTTVKGGDHGTSGDGCGTVFKLTPTSGSYTDSVLHSFSCTRGFVSGVILMGGKLYGTHQKADDGCCGAVFKTDPISGATMPAHEFAGYPNDGAGPVAPPPGGMAGVLWYASGHLVADSSGKLFGVTLAGGAQDCAAGSGSGYYAGCGTVYELSPRN